MAGVDPLAMDEMRPDYFRRLNYPDNYKTNNISIYKFEKNLDQEENMRLRYRLKNAFPKALSSTTVSYGPAELLRVTVTLGYDYYSVTKDKPGGTEESFNEQFAFDDPKSSLSRAATTPLSDYETQGAALEGLFKTSNK